MRMLRNGVMLTVVCVLLCLTFNYTFPLRRESSKWNLFGSSNNESLQCGRKHHQSLGRLKKLPSRIENTLKILDTANMKFKKKVNCFSSNLVDNLSHFEEMVIKKKNPYVDLKDYELKYYNPKNTRQSVDPGPNLVEDPGLCEPENSNRINVEIINRGLSGFAVPAKLLKNFNDELSRVNAGSVQNDLGVINTPAPNKQATSKGKTELLSALKDDIKQYEDSKAVKIL